MYSKNIDEILDQAIKDYFDFTIFVDLKNDTVSSLV